MISHDLHHGGEIGTLRDLYRERFKKKEGPRAASPQ